MERQAYDWLLQESLVKRHTMGGLLQALAPCFSTSWGSFSGRQAHMQRTLVKTRDQNERSKRDRRSSVEPAPTSSLTSAPAPINPLPHPLFDSISHLRTPAAQARLLSPRRHASQMVGTPLKHTRSALHRRQPNNKQPLKRTRSALQTRQVSPA